MLSPAWKKSPVFFSFYPEKLRNTLPLNFINYAAGKHISDLPIPDI
jgi:hypothetical protein